MIVVTSVRVERKTFENSCKTRRMDSDSEMTTGQQMDADISFQLLDPHWPKGHRCPM